MGSPGRAANQVEKAIAPVDGTGGGTKVAKEDRGFASMDRAKQREIASKGGKAAHQKGTAHEWTSDEARDAGRYGGQAESPPSRCALRRTSRVSTFALRATADKPSPESRAPSPDSFALDMI